MSVNSLLSKNELVELLKSDKEFRDSFALEFVKKQRPDAASGVARRKRLDARRIRGAYRKAEKCYYKA